MPKVLDRYLVREIVPPLAIALVGLTFALMMPPILHEGERLVEKGCRLDDDPSRAVDARAAGALRHDSDGAALRHPVRARTALGDREFVALQACGVSVFRIFQPIVFLSVLAAAATAYETIVALPAANQTYREITLNVIASWADSDIKPRVFFQNFPNRVLYVRDVQPGGGWRDVFLADDTQPDQTTVYLAERGRLVIDREKEKVELVLDKATRHTTYPSRPDDYDVSSYETLSIDMDRDTVFPKTKGPLKGDNEMTIKELRAAAAANEARGAPSYSQRYTIQQKFSLPAACFVLALIGVSLGATNRKDGKLGSFALGFGVVFVYYILLYTSRAFAMGGRLQPTLAPWLVNIVLFVAGLALVFWRAGAADQPIRINIPAFWRRPERSTLAPAIRRGLRRAAHASSSWSESPTSIGRGRACSTFTSRAATSRSSVWRSSRSSGFSTSRRSSTWPTSSFAAPRRRDAAALLLFPDAAVRVLHHPAVGAGRVAGDDRNADQEQRADHHARLRDQPVSIGHPAGAVRRARQPHAVRAAGTRAGGRQPRSGAPQRDHSRLSDADLRNPQSPVDRGTGGDIYHYEYFDPARNHFDRLSLFELDPAAWKLQALTYAKEVVLARPAWEARQGWRREFGTGVKRNVARTVVNYTPFASRPLGLEPPSYFKTDEPEADRMTYDQLSKYVRQLQASGYHAVPYMVQLQRKVAFPFVTVIMTVLAVPFAASMGRSGAMFGIGVGILLSIVYWTALSLFGALGAGGWISPMLGAWAPNILFGAAALTCC
jgi:lipopolysaccharide export LptBFGC system permease protein LptF